MQAFKHPSSAGLALVLSATLAGPAAAQTAPAAAAPAALHPALKAAAAEPGAVVTASGLVFRQIEAG